ncbi:hypothetical protein ABW19_dt0205567 [Dactylella cylindrospora]|nr:hypothetical protein ABW19_dt0205567 [Dactylella cylindrospora]
MDSREHDTEPFSSGSCAIPSSETAGSNNNTNPGCFADPSTFADLEHIIDNCSIIDNHAHSLLKKQTCKEFAASGLDLLSVTSEATGNALQDVTSTLAHHRAVRTLKKNFVFSSPPQLDDWEAWKAHRDTLDEEPFTKRCLQGIQTILIDDGLRVPKGLQAHEISWHDQFIRSPAKRILRLETVAEDLIQQKESFEDWKVAFVVSIREALHDPFVVGFKSVIAYRTGFDIYLLPDINATPLERVAADGFHKTKEAGTASGKYRINDRTFNPYLINILASEMRAHVKNGFRAKPLQFHTGFGDNDLKIQKSNPTFLVPFIERYPETPIALLHGAYPFTREAGYLASVYPHVYLDFGLIFPKISQEGQESVIKQVFELTPSSKAMWSTDGVYFGETYLLGVRQMREAFKRVMAEMHAKDSISLRSMAEIVTDSLFNTANKLYNLGLNLYIPPQHSILEEENEEYPLSGNYAVQGHRGLASLKIFKQFLIKHPGIEYLRLNWTDYSAILRTRILKVKHVIKQLEQNENGSLIGVTKASLYLLANCAIVPGGGPIGEWRLVPDFTSIHVHPHKREGETSRNHATVMCWIEDDNQSRVDLDPRAVLARAIERAKAVGLHDFKIGFEIEFCMFKQADLDEGRLTPITISHTWSTSKAFQNEALIILEDIDKELSEAGIEIEQFHSEAARGQYELILSTLPPMQAVDSLIHTREVIQYVCAKYGYKASLLPKPFDMECGSAAHMHISFKPFEKQWNFFAGVLDEIRAINSMTLGSELSYERILAGFWAGGIWGCWGRQNREAPVRLVEENKAHWEIKSVDGMANMYLAVAGILTAGTIGVKGKVPIYGECDSSTMTDAQRKDRGIKTPMVKSMEEALDALFENDGVTPTRFASELGSGVATHIAAVKRAEKEHLLSQFVNTEDGVVDIQRRRVWAAQWY